MASPISNIKNFYFPQTVFTSAYGMGAQSTDVKKNLSYYITKVQFQRIRQDIQSWRRALDQAEQMFFPYRSEMQRCFLDTVLNEHVAACMKRRKNLTLLRDFKMCDENGQEDKSLKLLFYNNTQKGGNNWFFNFLNYSLDALFFGYSLIYLDDLVNNAFPKLNIIRRENVSPDRLVVSSLPTIPGGINFTEPPFSDWHIWIPTPGETGRESCGYGLLYKIAKAEIYLRNNTAFNADYNELFGQPVRVGHTTKTDIDERNAFESSLQNMGASAYILLDEGEDKIEMVESKNTGTGHASYTDFEKRMEAKISKLLLGHADAVDSTPGKLGGVGKAGSAESPQDKALDEIQAEDGIFIENVVNSELIPRMQAFGINIPPNIHFEFLNSKETEEYTQKQNETAQACANVMLSVAQAGGKPDWEWFNERNDMNVQEAVVPGQDFIQDPADEEQVTEAIKNLLKLKTKTKA